MEEPDENTKWRCVPAVRTWPDGCGPRSDQFQPQLPSKEIEEGQIRNSGAETEEGCQNGEDVEGQNGDYAKRSEVHPYPPPKRRDIQIEKKNDVDNNLEIEKNGNDIQVQTRRLGNNDKINQGLDYVWLREVGREKIKGKGLSLGSKCEIRDEKRGNNAMNTSNVYKEVQRKGDNQNPPNFASKNVKTIATKQAGSKRKMEEEAELYDFAIPTITDSRRCIRKTARKSVRAPPQLILSERNAPKTENSNSDSLIIYKSGISNPLILNPYQNNTNEQQSNARTKIKQLLRSFHFVYRKKVQKKESNPRLNKKVQKEESNPHPNKKVDFRTDLKSANEIKKSPLYKTLNRDKAILGPVPGVEIGDEFRYRVEMHLIGLHRPPQGGIDSTKFNGVHVATSIVSSGGYSDEQRSSDMLIYYGSGGKPIGKKGQKSRPLDQKLEKGNLALKNSMDLKKPVRVIHGFNVGEGKKVVMNFVYDGLYMVVDYQYVDEIYNVCGKEYKAKVYKFILRRMAGQPESGLRAAGKLKNCRVRDGFLMSDISKGKEKVPICVINNIDNERPPKFDYIRNVIYQSWLEKSLLKGCTCRENCISVECSCAAKNGGNIPFISNGAIVEEKRVIYECGPACECPSSCPNKVSQKGIVYKLEVFRKELNEWGVRSLGSISCGSFVCEYVGEVREKDEVIMIDCGERGNVARFLKRSKSPNLMVQKVLVDHDDERMAHLMFFAAENIPPLQELTY